MNTKRLEAQIRGAFNDADRQAYQIEVQEVGGDRLLIFVGYYTDGVHENEVEAYVHHAASEEEIVEALDEAIACAAGERPEHLRTKCSPECDGWGLFDTGSGTEIERCDECARFDDDESAAAHAVPIIQRGLELMRDIAQNPLSTIRLLIVDFVPSTDLAELAEAVTGWQDDYKRVREEQALKRVVERIKQQREQAEDSAEADLWSSLLDNL